MLQMGLDPANDYIMTKHPPLKGVLSHIIMTISRNYQAIECGFLESTRHLSDMTVTLSFNYQKTG
jgi:hypothetical protein